MKIAFCLFKYFPYGGLQRDFLRIAKACKQRGHEIHVFTQSWEGESEPDLNIHIIPVKGWQNHTRNQAFANQVKIVIAQLAPDIVVGFNKMPNLDIYYAADVCYQARIHHSRPFWYRLSPRYHRLLSLEKSVFTSGSQTEILLISSQQKNEFIRYYQTDVQRMHLLPPGIAKDRIAPPHAETLRMLKRKEYQLTQEDVLLLMVGSGFKTKGLDRAIYALAGLDTAIKAKTKLWVIGDDNPKSFIALAKKLRVDKQIKFLGGRPDVPDFLLAADLLIHPAYHENTGTVLLEALVAGLPVLTVDVCGYAHYVLQANAGEVIASPFKQIELNTALQRMILTMTSSSLSQQWRKNALDFAKTADIYNMPEKAADFIERAAFFNFNKMMMLQGQPFRQLEGRKTQRVELNGKFYFIKQHHGVGWKEIFKNLIQGRLPVLSAKNEWLAIQKLQSLGVDTAKLLAYGQRGVNPARLKSFVLMEEIAPSTSLEMLSQTWAVSSPPFSFKQKLIEEVAKVARTLHQNGINHRDFYLCHFLLKTSDVKLMSSDVKLALIDLHRAQIRRVTPKRWMIKDLAGLYFSSKDIGLTQRDLFRFMKIYQSKTLNEIISENKSFWNKVKKRGEKLYRDHFAK